MSLESDVSYSVKVLVNKIKAQVQINLNKAVEQGHLTLEEGKVEGVNRLIQNTVDQAFVEGSELLTNTLRAHSKN